MSPFDESGFYKGLHDLVRDIAGVSAAEFERRWQRARTKADEPWLQQTSAFNIDTALLESACEEFLELSLFSRLKIHELFFRFRKPPGFGKHLIGS
jgi:hypothetical protein